MGPPEAHERYQLQITTERKPMKKQKFFTFGMIWLTVAAATFLQFVQTEDRILLTRTGVFMLIGILYLYMNDKKKK